MEQKQSLTVADILAAAEPTAVCYMCDDTHEIFDATTVAEIMTGKSMFDWATAVVTRWYPTAAGDLKFTAVLQNSVEMSKRLQDSESIIASVAEDITAINDMLQKSTADLTRIKEYAAHISALVKPSENIEED